VGALQEEELVKIGTRESDLARTQTAAIAEKISKGLGGKVEQILIKTKGDIVTDRPLREIEGTGYFTKELEEALLDGSIDIAVHSFKDMPSQIPEGLVLAAISDREDPADLLIIDKESFEPSFGEIPLRKHAIVGTSAVRRAVQVRAIRNDIETKDLRGNVSTRVRKLAEKQYDAIFLAAAGVRRLNLDLGAFQVVRLDPIRFVPSPGQGALAIQMRNNDKNIEQISEFIHNKSVATATGIERSVMARFGGGCSLPLGVYAWFDNGSWHARGFWGESPTASVWASASDDDPVMVSEKLYRLLKKGSE
jgi:hydroxymethylbilane synthase